jgi:hypothetical protein
MTDLSLPAAARGDARPWVIYDGKGEAVRRQPTPLPPDAPRTLAREIADRPRGAPRIELQTRYVPRADPEEYDPFAERDLMVAKALTRVLLQAYPGHFWETGADHSQGIAWISIPILMGGNWKHVFRLSEDLTPIQVIRAGGEILERFNIPRSTLDLPAFLIAKRRAISRASDKVPT